MSIGEASFSKRKSQVHHPHYPQNYLSSKYQYYVPYDSPVHFVSTACLHKYFPKYHCNLTLHLSSHKTFSKIKSLKRISTITIHTLQEPPKNSWRPLLSSQKKLLQALPIFTYYVETCDEQITSQAGAYGQARFFTNLKEISFSPEGYFDARKLSICEDKSVSQASRYLAGLKGLKRVEITLDREVFLKPVTCLERQERSLGQLESLSVSVKTIPWRGATNLHELTKSLLMKEKFLKHVTSIALEENIKVLGGLPEVTPDLKEINFDVKRKQENETNGESVLSSLERFKDLKVLGLKVADSKMLLKEFTMPMGIEDVSIQWSDVEDVGNMTRIEYMLKNQERYGGALLGFLEKWGGGLTRMKRLEIGFEDVRDPGLLMNELVERIISKLEGLKELKVKIEKRQYYSYRDQEEEEEGDKVEEFIDLTSFLQSIPESLNSIELDIRIPDENRREPKQVLRPRNLRIKGKIKGENLRENFGVLFAERFQGFEIQLDCIWIYSVEEFVKFIESMGKMKRPRDMKISFDINWKIFDMEGFKEGMKQLQQRMKYMKGVWIEIMVYIRHDWHRRVERAVEELKEVFEGFRAGYVMYAGGVEDYLKDHPYD